MDVSLVIPVYNEEKYIEKCLESVFKQTILPNEVIIVDNNSTDKTIEIAKRFPVKIIKESKQGLSFARNTGFDKSKYELIARTDADAILPKNWVKKIINNFKKNKIDALSGSFSYFGIFNKPTSTTPSKIYLETLSAFSNGKRYLFGPNTILTRKIWLKAKHLVNSDDTKVHEDINLSICINKVGGKIGYDPTLCVQVSGRRIRGKPQSFFIEYPIRLVNTLLQ